MARSISTMIAVCYLFLGYITGGGVAVWQVGMSLLWPLAYIWFPDEIGSWTGLVRLQKIMSESPGVFVAFMGWVLLLLPAGILVVGVLAPGPRHFVTGMSCLLLLIAVAAMIVVGRSSRM